MAVAKHGDGVSISWAVKLRDSLAASALRWLSHAGHVLQGELVSDLPRDNNVRWKRVGLR